MTDSVDIDPAKPPRFDRDPSHAALQLENLSKTFPGVKALDDVSLAIPPGETLALLGHNGSGKSTLIKVLAGFHHPDGGARGWIHGEPFKLGSPDAARARGLRFVHQDLGLIPQLNAVDNVALSTGYSRSRTMQIDQARQVSHTTELLDRFDISLDVTLPLSEASPVERTCVAIARALWDWEEGPRILVLDEPTAALPSREVSRLFDVIRQVRAAGHPILYISHRMDEIFEIADEMVVLRAGRVVGRGRVDEQTPRHLAELIAGHGLSDQAAPAVKGTKGNLALRAQGLRSEYLANIDISVNQGEILGIAGLLGSGRDELPYVLTGAAASVASAPWELDGEEIDPPRTPNAAAALGIGFVPAERGREGLIAPFTVGENLTFGALPRLQAGLYLGRKRERAQAREWLEEIGIPVDTLDRPVSTLSGGNQQRVLLARCLYTNPKVLVMSEPTAGVDVGARQMLYDVLRARAGLGLGIVLASSDAEDLLSICDRVLVLVRGQVAAEMKSPIGGADQIVAVMEEAA
jgi:ribose transport system ATP-binding protein